MTRSILSICVPSVTNRGERGLDQAVQGETLDGLFFCDSGRAGLWPSRRDSDFDPRRGRAMRLSQEPP